MHDHTSGMETSSWEAALSSRTGYSGKGLSFFSNGVLRAERTSFVECPRKRYARASRESIEMSVCPVLSSSET